MVLGKGMTWLSLCFDESLLGGVGWWGEAAQRENVEAGRPVCEEWEVPSRVEKKMRPSLRQSNGGGSQG